MARKLVGLFTFCIKNLIVSIIVIDIYIATFLKSQKVCTGTIWYLRIKKVIAIFQECTPYWHILDG